MTPGERPGGPPLMCSSTDPIDIFQRSGSKHSSCSLEFSERHKADGKRVTRAMFQEILLMMTLLESVYQRQPGMTTFQYIWLECKARKRAVHALIGVSCSSAGFHLSDFSINLSSLHSLCKIKQIVTKCVFHLMYYHEKCILDALPNVVY